MRIAGILISAALLATTTTAALAQGTLPTERWQFARQTEFQTNVAWIYGRFNGGPSEFGVECTDTGPEVYFADGLRYDGDTRQGRVGISVDGRDYSRQATFVPHGHTSWWRIAPGNGLLDALRAGNTVTLDSDLGTGLFPFRLRGSSAAIGEVLAICGEGAAPTTAATGPTAATTGLTAAAPEARIREACRGAYSGEDAIVQTEIDGDGKPDFLLDWSSVTCADRSVGRGGGYCGAQMCSIDVYASSAYAPGGWPQPILALSYALPAPGADHALTTTVTGGSCPITHRCTRHWGWTGGKLEVVAREDVDASQAPSPEAPEPSTSAQAPLSRTPPAEADAAIPWTAPGMEPGQWNSVVPENAMGFVLAAHPNFDGTQLMLSCGAGGGLQINFSAPELANVGPEDDVRLRLGTETFPTRFHEDIASGGDPSFYMAGRWDGQVRLLELLNAGEDAEVIVIPDDNPSAAKVVLTVPGSAGDPGLAHVVDVCGDGPKVAGPVQSFPGVFGDAQSGAWVLRHRTENFTVPVARSIDPRNGAAFGLHCSEEGLPSMHIGWEVIPDGETRGIVLRIGGRDFARTGYGNKSTITFPADADLMEAMRNSDEVIFVRDDPALTDGVFPTTGFDGAVDFTYTHCE
ncbi:hypothetical protein [Allosediminivita pacifica]|uniref:Uncharacterized protein n=1 Tax=Allosediminivita pacifica TaxID=1267769 RepID=A0A2T6B7M3_9RHOB|nr:hypothetical protein [Allosediminivita pacifica]PTX52069.1 hypothetical protein C8N44_102114 [Allosediminivita pacifica]GGA97428.1 hypothetical protein GCM10011324_04600 [Allosediminivita pacifica]